MILEGRTALVTGASRGIGRAAAAGLAREGARLVLVARETAGVERAAKELREQGHEAEAHALDVSDAAAVERLAEALGGSAVDVLVNCAAVMPERRAKMTLRTSPEEWRRVLGTNLDGPFHLVAAFAPGMVKRRHGRIINVSACLGRMSGPGTRGGLASYRVSKAALNAFTKNLAAEMRLAQAPDVWVDAVCPGHSRTDMGGEGAPRSAEQGADTIVWLATRTEGPTGQLWEDREVLPW